MFSSMHGSIAPKYTIFAIKLAVHPVGYATHQISHQLFVIYEHSFFCFKGVIIQYLEVQIKTLHSHTKYEI